MSPSGPGRSPAQKRQRMEVEGLRSRTGRRRRIELSWNWKWMQRKLCEELFENSSFSGYWKSDWFCYCIGNLAEIFQDSECSPHCTRILNKCFDLRMLREKHQTLWTLAFPLFFRVHPELSGCRPHSPPTLTTGRTGRMPTSRFCVRWSGGNGTEYGEYGCPTDQFKA